MLENLGLKYYDQLYCLVKYIDRTHADMICGNHLYLNMYNIVTGINHFNEFNEQNFQYFVSASCLD